MNVMKKKRSKERTTIVSDFIINKVEKIINVIDD